MIRTLDIGPVTIIHGTGNHPPRYIAWVEARGVNAEEVGSGLRGWGQTAREAKLDLEKQLGSGLKP